MCSNSKDSHVSFVLIGHNSILFFKPQPCQSDFGCGHAICHRCASLENPDFYHLAGFNHFRQEKGRITALLVVVILLLSDQLSSSVIKPWINRTRPCFVLGDVRLLIEQSGSPSFPSSHAANMAAMATLFAVKYRRLTVLFVAVALLVSYSRIYVGVHYPSDLLGGWVVGMACAATVLMIETQVGIFFKNRLHEKTTPE